MFGLRNRKNGDTGETGGFLARLRRGINRGTSWLAGLVPGRKVDAEVLDELETRLLAADLGVEITGEIPPAVR